MLRITQQSKEAYTFIVIFVVARRGSHISYGRSPSIILTGISQKKKFRSDNAIFMLSEVYLLYYFWFNACISRGER
jgi:hypothetical protein